MAKTDTTLISVQRIYFGDVQSDGSFPTTWEKVSGKLVPDQAVMSLGEPEKTDLYIVESDFPYMSIPGSRDVSFKFNTRDFTVDMLVYAFGGTKISEDQWKAPILTTIRTKAVRIVTGPGNDDKVMVFRIAKAYLAAALTGQMVKTDTGSIDFTVVPLVPQDANGDNLPPYWVDIIFNPYLSPTVPVVDDETNTFGWTAIDNYATATDYEYTIDAGVSYDACTANPQTGITGAIDAGDVGVRLKESANGYHGPSPTLWSTEAYTA
ncbi:MAG TPA: hypothetical protein VMW32_05700 [Bacteroidales bacterium]|nr:hypothetical protein [Bacteroidales bacterium]